MIQGLVSFLVTGLLNVIAFVIGVIFYPIYLVITSIFPDFSSFWDTALDYYTGNLLQGVAFIREVFFNVTGFPRELFNLIIGYFVAKLLIHVTLTAINFIINAWALIKGGKSHG